MEVFIMEIWKTISDFNKYEVSNYGRIRNKKGNILKPRPMTSGYSFVALRKGGGTYQRSIHRLVATEFIPKPVDKNIVHHIDENKKNNHVDNLKWCTQMENIHYGTGLSKMGTAHKKPIIMITPDNKEIKYKSALDCENETGIKRGYINQVLKGRYTQTSGGYKFKYDK